MLVLFAAAASAVLLAAYGVRVAVLGRYEHERARKEPGSFFLGRFLIEFGYWCFAPLERAAVSLGITPNQITVASLACSIAGAAAFAVGKPDAGGGLVILCAILDALDGMVAGTRGTASEAGELIDAAVDRYAEIATFAGIAAYYRTYPLGFWLAIVSLGGALLVSYARAKGEINGIDARMGAMNRGERAMYIGIAGVFSPPLAHVVEPGAIHPVYHLLLATLVLVGVLVAVGWNLPLHRYFVFRHGASRARPSLAWIGALASGTAAVAVLFVAYGMPFAEESVHGFSTQADDSGKVTQTSYLPKLLPEAFYSESYSFLFQADDGSFARVQFLVSNAGLEGHGGAAARAVLVTPDGKTIEDAEAFEAGQWRVLPEGAIEMGAHSLTMGADASHHLHFAGKKLVFDATVLPQTKALRPGGGRVTFDAGGRAVFDQTIFALRSKFDATVWSSDRGGRRVRGGCDADTSYSTVPAYKSASLWYRMEAFDEGAAMALAVLIPPEGSRTAPQGWLYTTRDGQTEVRSSEVKLSFQRPKRETGGRFEYDVPQRVVASARGALGERVTVTIDAKRLLYKEDVLGEMSPLSRFLVSIMAAPMSYTYENHYELHIERPGSPAEHRTGAALSEFAYANPPSQLAQF